MASLCGLFVEIWEYFMLIYFVVRIFFSEGLNFLNMGVVGGKNLATSS
jgi:hypothetical protein